ncbi:hypothetical protein HDV00_007959 [Rhizophlyctis rosea]|nr:hypothetical protein HDV00_007959 [Rhizophlyctis rosea]
MPLLPGVTLNDETLYDDVPYNQITYAMAHDSHTGMNSDPSNTAVDQSEDVYHQLQGGIRVLRINTGSGYDQWPGRVILRHNDPGSLAEAASKLMGKGGLFFGMLDDYLKDVKRFLDENPNALVTIIDEGGPVGGQTSSQHHNQFIQVFYDVFGGIDILFSPEVFGYIARDVYKMDPWPTPREIKVKDYRIVLFKNPDPDVDWGRMLPRKSYAENPYANKADRDQRPWWLKVRPNDQGNLIADDVGNILKNIMMPSDQFDRALADGEKAIHDAVFSVFLFNHFYYDKLHGPAELAGMFGGDPILQASREYSVWGVGDLIIESTLRAWFAVYARNRKPNFINTDFYQGENGYTSYLIYLVNLMNSSKTPSEAARKVHDDKKVVIADTNIVIGEFYWLNVIWNTRDRLTWNTATQQATLAPPNDTDPYQQWRVIYNLPAAGLALWNIGGRVKLQFPSKEALSSPCTGVPANYYPLKDSATREELYARSGLEFRPHEMDGATRILIRMSADKGYHLETEGHVSPTGARVFLAEWHNV